MKKQMVALLLGALGTVSAQAAVVVTSVQSAADGGYAASGTTTAGSVLFNFDSSNTLSGTLNGFTLSNNNTSLFGIPLVTRSQIATGNTTNSSTPVNDTTNYLAITQGGTQTFQNSAQGFNTLSLYWGTPDDFNTINLLDAAGASIAQLTRASFTGLDALSGSSALVSITSDQNIYGVTLGSSGNAFELDNVRFSNVSGAVPEPATWGMMILGFGAIGFGMRRRAARTSAAEA